MKYTSRNKKVDHEWYFNCPYCKEKFIKEDLIEGIDYDTFSDNTIIVYCRKCGWEFVPNVTHDIIYKYN